MLVAESLLSREWLIVIPWTPFLLRRNRLLLPTNFSSPWVCEILWRRRISCSALKNMIYLLLLFERPKPKEKNKKLVGLEVKLLQNDTFHFERIKVSQKYVVSQNINCKIFASTDKRWKDFTEHTSSCWEWYHSLSSVHLLHWLNTPSNSPRDRCAWCRW